ncbi:MAG: iron ABC transporter permease [Paracoccaceae bacterium]
MTAAEAAAARRARPAPRASRLIPGGEGLAFAALLAFVAGLCGAPLLLLLEVGLGDGLAPVAKALESGSVRRALWRSLESGAASALLATGLGTALALAIGLTDVRAKPALVFLVLLPMMIPPHVTAIAWIQALGPGSPVLKPLGLAPELGATHPLYSREGVILLLAVQHSPLVFLAVRAALRALPREMAEAARAAGASGPRVLRRVILPLIAPALIAGFALAFVSALGNFGIPALLGIPARYITLPVLIWQRLASFGPGMLEGVAVLAFLIACVAAAAVAVQGLLARRAKAVLSGPPSAPLDWALGRWRPATEAGVWAVIALTLVLPLGALLGTALVPTYGVDLSVETLTLRHFREIVFGQSVTWRAFGNSVLAAGGASAILAGTALGLGAFLARGGARGRAAGAAAGVADLAYAVPGLVISIAFILAFIRPLPLIGVSLYGTLWIILLAYLAAFLAIALKPVGAAVAQLDPALDDAARVAGAGWGRRLRRVFAPMTAPAAASGAILVFLTAYNEVTVSALLWSSGHETVGTVIFNYEDGGYTTLASAMSAVTVALTALLMLLLDRLGRRLPPGVVPWR